MAEPICSSGKNGSSTTGASLAAPSGSRGLEFVAANNTRRGLPPGLLSGLLFFAVVLAGSGYIVFSKLHEFSAFNVTAVPVLVMVGYALVLGVARLFRLRDDQSGDNLYYMGFLFTLTSLAVSLYQFTSARTAEPLVQNFGIAIAS